MVGTGVRARVRGMLQIGAPHPQMRTEDGQGYTDQPRRVLSRRFVIDIRTAPTDGGGLGRVLFSPVW
jgi:hypothetical protein